MLEASTTGAKGSKISMPQNGASWTIANDIILALDLKKHAVL